MEIVANDAEAAFYEIPNDPDFKESCGPVPPLWHYTGASGFHGIVTSLGRLKATDVRFLNDASEVKYGLAIVKDVLRAAKMPSKELQSKVLSGVEDLSRKRVFVASLSTHSDMLSQWRFYADDAKGYCVRLRPRERWGVRNHDLGTCQWLLQCKYKPRQLRQRMLHRLRYNLTVASESPGLGDAWLIRQLVATAHRTAALAKQPMFAAENEWRIVVDHAAEDVCYDVRSGKLVPFILTLETEICEVLVGPGAGGAAAVDATRGFLAQHDIADVDVREWDAPYRGR